MPKTIGAALLLSDQHTLGTTALAPLSFTTEQGIGISPARVQMYLLDCWNDMIGRVKQWKRDNKTAKLWWHNNGDAVEGFHHASIEVMALDPADHANAFIELADPLIGTADIISIVAGTEAHVGQRYGIERIIAAHINQARPGVLLKPEHGSMVWPHIMHDFLGTRFICAHHTTGGAGEIGRNRAMAARVQDYLKRRGLKDDPEPRAHYMIFSHIHGFGDSGETFNTATVAPEKRIEHEDTQQPTRALTTGCWQYSTTYGNKIKPLEDTQIGGWFIELYDDGTSRPFKWQYPAFREVRQYVVTSQVSDSGNTAVKRKPALPKRKNEAADTQRAISRYRRANGSTSKKAR